MRSIRKILYLPIETIVRELDACLLLAHEAMRRDYKVVLGDSNEVKLFSRYMQGGAYLYKQWEARFPYRFDDERRANYYYLGLHQEGVVWIDQTNFLRKMTEKGRSEKLDINFVKGELQKNMLADFYPALASKLRVAGGPDFDLLRPQFRALFEEEANRLREAYGPYLLINTNFSLGNRARNETNDIVAARDFSSRKNFGRPLSPEERDVIVGWIDFHKRIWEEYRTMIVSLSEKFPSLTIILRPHPSEDHDSWKEALKDLPNVRVIYEGNVINWILGSVGVVHTGCTTGIEAWALRIPVIRFNPLDEHSPYESELANKFGIYASSLESVSSLVQRILDGKYDLALYDSQLEILRPYLASADGPLATERLLNHIDALGNFSNEGDNTLEIRRYVRENWRRIARTLLVRAVVAHTWFTGLVVGHTKAVARAAMFQKFPALTARTVRSELSRIARLQDSTHPLQFRIQRVDSATYYLERL